MLHANRACGSTWRKLRGDWWKKKPSLSQKGQAPRQASSLKAVEIGEKQCDKEGSLFGSSKCNQKQARKNRLPQFKIPIAAVALKSAST